MEIWQKSYDMFLRKTYTNTNYKIKLGRSFRNLFARSWIGYKLIDGRYKYICSYFFSQFDSPDSFIPQIEYEFSLPNNEQRENILYKKLYNE